MTTATSTHVDPDLEQAVREAIQPPCEATVVAVCLVHGQHVHTCDQPAEWVLHTQCNCGQKEQALLCADHLMLIQHVPGVIRCPTCGGRAAITSAEPLR